MSHPNSNWVVCARVRTPQSLLVEQRVAVFLTACEAHEERGTPGWTTLKAGGVVLRDAFAEWHSGVVASRAAAIARAGGAAALAPAPARRLWINNCTLPCNPNQAVCAPLVAEAEAGTAAAAPQTLM